MSQLLSQLAGAEAEEFWLLAGLMLAAAGFGLFWTFVAYGRARLVADMPTARIRSAAQGYVELEGRTQLMEGPEILGPLTRLPCVWWRFRIEQRKTVVSNGRRTTRWVTIENKTSDSLFLLDDGSGECVVDPEAAHVIASVSERWHGSSVRPDTGPKAGLFSMMGRYRYFEELIPPGTELYALGQFRTQIAHQEFDQALQVRELLADWKADERKLLSEFDTDGDGEINLEEWEQARRKAIEQVRRHLAEVAADPDIHVLSRPPDRRPFILSAQPQDKVIRSQYLQAGAAFTAFLAGGSALIAALVARGVI